MFGSSGNLVAAVGGWYEFRQDEKERFMARGRAYTDGFLDAHRGIWWLYAVVIGDGRYYGACDAKKELESGMVVALSQKPRRLSW